MAPTATAPVLLGTTEYVPTADPGLYVSEEGDYLTAEALGLTLCRGCATIAPAVTLGFCADCLVEPFAGTDRLGLSVAACTIRAERATAPRKGWATSAA